MAHKKFWMRALALGLGGTLLLSGCGGEPAATGTPAESGPAESAAAESEAPTDWSKYNCYLRLAERMYEMESALMVYFDNVEYTEEFILKDGGDYSAIKDALQFYTLNTYAVEEALDYTDETPAYPDADTAMKNLGDSPAKVMEALNHMASYTRFDEYEEDNMAQAPELHAELWEALQTYDRYYADFLDAIDVLSSQGRDEDREQLLADGEMILYYSLYMLHTSEDVVDNIWDQIEAANSEEGAEFVLPAVDMTDLSPLFGEFQTAYDGLTEAMANEEEMEKIDSFTGVVGDTAIQFYTNRVNALYSWMGTLAGAIMDGSDYSEAFDSTREAISNMIDSYNSII